MIRTGDTDRLEVLQRFLGGVARGDDANQLLADLDDLHMRNDTFPGEVLMDLSADALEIAGAARERPVAYRDLLTTHLPEVTFRGKEQRRLQYAILTAYAVPGGLKPDLLDEVTY